MKPKQCRYSENQIVESSVKLTTLHCQLSILEVELTTQLLQSYCILIMGHVCLGTTRLLNSNLHCYMLCVMWYVSWFHHSCPTYGLHGTYGSWKILVSEDSLYSFLNLPLNNIAIFRQISSPALFVRYDGHRRHLQFLRILTLPFSSSPNPAAKAFRPTKLNGFEGRQTAFISFSGCVNLSTAMSTLWHLNLQEKS